MQNSRKLGYMDYTLLDTLIKKTLQDYRCVEFCWHGGEPLLVPDEVYEWIVERQKLYSTKYHCISNTLQTNGTLINEKRAELFKKLRFSIGISFDGLIEAQNELRPYRNGNQSYEKVINGIQAVSKVFGGVGLCCVISQRNVHEPEKTYYYLKESGATAVNLIPHMNYPKKDDLSVDSLELLDFWISFMRVYMADTFSFTKISPLFQYISSLLGKREDHCICNTDCLGDAISIDVDGNIFLCDLIDDKTHLGNINELTGLKKIFESPVYVKIFDEAKNFIQDYCSECEWIDICGAGCRVQAFSANGTVGSLDPLCEARKGFIKWIYQELKSIS